MTALADKPPRTIIAPSGEWRDWFLREIHALNTPAVDVSAEYRVAATEKSPMRFALTYLSHHLVSSRNDISFSEFHLDSVRTAKGWRRPVMARDAWIAPRGAAKSTWYLLVLPLWALCHGHRSFFLSFSYTEQMAARQLHTLRRELYSNELLLSDFPEMRPARGKGSQDNATMVVSSGATIATAGLGGTTLGIKSGSARPDLICHRVGTPILHDGRWVPVEQHPSFAGLRESDGRNVRVWGLPFEEVVTSEHRYWAKWVDGRRAKARDATWVEAGELEGHHYIGAPIDTTVRPAPAWTESVRVDGASRDELGRVRGATWERQQVRPDRLDDPEFWWLVGYWWGNGHLGSRHDQGPNCATVSVTVPNSHPEYVRRVHSAAHGKVRAAVRTERHGASTMLSWSDAPLARWLRTWKTPDAGQAEKTPPSWTEQLPLALQRALVEGYADADGDQTKATEVRVSSIWLPGLLTLRRIQARLGVAVTIRKGPGPRQETFPDGRQVWSKQKYDARWSLRQERYATTRTHIADGFLWSKVRDVAPVESEKFAPITTAGHTYVTAFGLSHNCGDDLEPNESNYSPDMRTKLLNKLLEGILPMGDDRTVTVFTGTVTMYDSIMHQVVRHARGVGAAEWIEANQFRTHYYPGVIEDPVTGAERSLWPQRWPLTDTHLGEHLRRTSDGRVPRAFALNYLLDPTPSEGSRGANFWREDLFVYSDTFNVLEQVLYIDPAQKTGAHNDPTAMVVVSVDPSRRKACVEYARAAHLTGEEVRQRALRLVDMNPDLRTVIIEENVRGAEDWQRIMSPPGYPWPKHVALKFEWASGHKVTRIKEAAGHYERSNVVHRRQFKDLEEQALLFGDPRQRDDLCDALAGALKWALGGGGKYS